MALIECRSFAECWLYRYLLECNLIISTLLLLYNYIIVQKHCLLLPLRFELFVVSVFVIVVTSSLHSMLCCAVLCCVRWKTTQRSSRNPWTCRRSSPRSTCTSMSRSRSSSTTSTSCGRTPWSTTLTGTLQVPSSIYLYIYIYIYIYVHLYCINTIHCHRVCVCADRQIRHRACALKDTIHTIIKHELDEDFEKICEEIKESRSKRGESVTKNNSWF